MVDADPDPDDLDDVPVLPPLAMALERYRDAFDDAPPIDGLPLDDPDLIARAVDVLDDAIEAGEPLDEGGWYERLGITRRG